MTALLYAVAILIGLIMFGGGFLVLYCWWQSKRAVFYIGDDND